MTARQSSALAGRRVVVGICGGIAAYKSAYLVRLLIKAGATVRVVMSPSAREFIGELTFQALTGEAAFTDLFDRDQDARIGHIALADWAEVVVVAPATATTIADAAAGRADNALTAVLLATRAPIVLAPSMNMNMWENPITQRNLRSLIELRDVVTVGPGSGFLACNWDGPGRLAEPETILAALERVVTTADLAGRRLLITAGPTREALDPVRFLSNRSTGKMGFAIARSAARRGGDVTLVSGPVALETPPGVTRVDVTSAAEMYDATIERSADADIIICAAAVADFRPANPAAGKIKKSESQGALKLERTRDILAELGSRRGSDHHPVLIGFAAETGDPTESARAKLARKNVDLIVGNDVSQVDSGFAADENTCVLVTSGDAKALPRMSKHAVADEILDRALALAEENR